MTVVRVARAAGSLLLLMLICTGCGETYRPVATPLIPTQPNPAASHFVMFLSSNGTNNPGASTTIDVSGDTALAEIGTGLMPVHGALVQGGSKLYVANSLDDTVSTFAPVTPIPITTISLPTCAAAPCSKPVFVASTENTTVYVASTGNGSENAATYLANSGNGVVYAISITNNVIENTIPVGVNPVAMGEIPNGQKLYVANQGNGIAAGSVTSINPLDQSTSPVAPPANTTWIAPAWVASRSDSQRAYILDQGSGLVSAIETVFDSQVGNVSVGIGANYMVYDPMQNRLYVINPVARTLNILDAANDALPVLGTISFAAGAANAPCPAGCAPVSVTVLPDGSRAYVATTALSGTKVTSQVTVISAADISVKKTVALTSVPQMPACSTARFELAAAAAADSTRVYVSNCDAGSAGIIQTSNDTLVMNLPAPLSALPPVGGTPPPQLPLFMLAGP